MKLLCISRKHPPSVGGMQLMNYELISRLARGAECTVIKWGGSQAFLPLFLPWAFLRSLALLPAGRRPDAIYLGDALLSPLGLVLGKILRRPVAVTAHGLDLTFRFPLYRSVVGFCLARLDRVIGVSRSTTQEARALGVPAERSAVIPNGVDCEHSAPRPSDTEAASAWCAEKRVDLSSRRPLLVTLGRLVKRKGVALFVREALPPLVSAHPRLLYLVIGEGKERRRIEAGVERGGLGENVVLAGRLPGAVVRGLMGGADIFVMPNVKVPGDMEGFGLAALEASCAGLPVVASDIEGIRDAIEDSRNGFLVPPGNSALFAEKIESLLKDEEARKKAGIEGREYTAAHCGWDACAGAYLEELTLLARRGARG